MLRSAEARVDLLFALVILAVCSLAGVAFTARDRAERAACVDRGGRIVPAPPTGFPRGHTTVFADWMCEEPLP